MVEKERHEMNRTFKCMRCNSQSTRHTQAQDVCESCQKEHLKEGSKASAILNNYIKKHAFSKATEKLCVDCGCRAHVHDHRDYTKPLEVDPVCFSCNSIRGMALDSKLRSFPESSKKNKVLVSVGLTSAASIRLTIPHWAKLRELMAHHHGRAWLEALIDKAHRKIAAK
jgi:hypothetical protein